MRKLNHFIKLFFVAIILFLNSVNVHSQDSTNSKLEIGIYERLGQKIPDDIILTDEKGQQVNLKSLVNKPTIFTLVYFRCPGICSPLLNGVSQIMNRIDMEPGKDFDVITISFDPTEKHELAASKKESYFTELNRKIPDNSWRFLTGDSVNVHKITDALGFKYQRQGNDYMHSAAIMVTNKDGQIARYLYGVEFLPFDFKMAVTEASEGKILPSVNRLMKMCFSFDPEGRKYVLNVTRVAGAFILLSLGIFIGFVTFKKKKITTKNI